MEFPRTAEDIFKDYKGRRAGILMALTEESDELYGKCDPDRDNLCLYGEPEGTWIVDLPAEEVPPELPDPVLGINFARDGMAKRDWLSLVAVHSDSWLLSVAFFFAASLDAYGRARLFGKINELQTLHEVVTDKPKAKVSKQVASGGPSSGKNKRKRGKEVVEAEAVAPAPLFPPAVNGQLTAKDTPLATGRLLAYSDISQSLKGRSAELFWPDDNLWYLVKILSVNVRNRTAKIIYETGDVEELQLDEIVTEGHMSLISP
mmetsp:Transcript_118/g.418  ORF Transcript_118/g.418 Transcript_118/m.418 type:complete len:261 (+) Transcript_118:498-1280(+)